MEYLCECGAPSELFKLKTSLSVSHIISERGEGVCDHMNHVKVQSAIVTHTKHDLLSAGKCLSKLHTVIQTAKSSLALNTVGVKAAG